MDFRTEKGSFRVKDRNELLGGISFVLASRNVYNYLGGCVYVASQILVLVIGSERRTGADFSLFPNCAP